jgi:hypothetical protein
VKPRGANRASSRAIPAAFVRADRAEFRAELLGKLTTKSAINVFSALSSLFRRAREWDLIADVPTSGHRPPRAELRAELGWWTVKQAAHALTVRASPAFSLLGWYDHNSRSREKNSTTGPRWSAPPVASSQPILETDPDY